MLVMKIPDGDTQLRFVCERCHAVHYENPKIVVGCLPEWEDRILTMQTRHRAACRALDVSRGIHGKGRNVGTSRCP